MDTDPRLTSLKDSLLRLQQDGVRRIAVTSLIDAVAKLETVGTESTLTAVDLEKYRAQLAMWVEQYKAQANIEAEGFKSVILAGQTSLRSAMLINGGAAVAVLAYIGRLTGDAAGNVAQFALPLFLFVLGALVVAVGAGVTYLSQWFYFGGGGWKSKVGFGLNILAMLLGVGSWALFATGAWLAYLAFSGLAAGPPIGV